MISFIIPTLGRPSLLKTLASIEVWPGDEVLIVGQVPNMVRGQAHYISCPAGGDWGHSERNYAMPLARCRYMAHIDDDDTYARGTRALMASAITQAPGRPTLFRMQYPNGITLWRDEKIYCGNVGTPMMLIPNMPTKLGVWRPFIGGDCAFLEESKWKPEEYNWRPEIIALLGHNT